MQTDHYAVLKTQPEQQQTFIDWAMLNTIQMSLGSDGPEGRETMLCLFESALPPQIEAIVTAFTQGDIVQVHQAAHRLRGGSLQLGAVGLVALCEEIESATTINLAADTIAQLHDCYADTHRLLRQHYAQQ